MKRGNRFRPSAEDIIELSNIEILHPGGAKLTQRTAELCDLKPGMKVLDVSSGRGTQSIYYAKHFGVEVTGLDLSEKMIKQARDNVKKENLQKHITFLKGDSQSLPFEDGEFDVVINECAVGIPDDSQKVLNEMQRVTKRGGKVAIHESLWLQSLSQAEKDEVCDRYGTTPFELKEWVSMLEMAGVSEIHHEYEEWSDPKMFFQIREGREIKNHRMVFTFKERLSVLFAIVKEYGLKGLVTSYQNEQYLWKRIYAGVLGYGLFVGTAS